MTTEFAIRPERPDDVDAIDRLIIAAFAGEPHSEGNEARIVHDLRNDGVLLSSLVAEDQTPEAGGAQRRRWFVPVRFGGEHGEDLTAVAERAGLTPEEVVGLHCAAEYRVYMLGFSPGFAYLGGLPEALHQPRRENPRSVTPAGSFMQGGAQAALSPVAMPSGWHLIGKTPLRLFDPGRSQPFLLSPGDRVRLVSVTVSDYDRMYGQPDLLPESEAVG